MFTCAGDWVVRPKDLVFKVNMSVHVLYFMNVPMSTVVSYSVVLFLLLGLRVVVRYPMYLIPGGYVTL